MCEPQADAINLGNVLNDPLHACNKHEETVCSWCVKTCRKYWVSVGELRSSDTTGLDNWTRMNYFFFLFNISYNQIINLQKCSSCIAAIEVWFSHITGYFFPHQFPEFEAASENTQMNHSPFPLWPTQTSYWGLAGKSPGENNGVVCVHTHSPSRVNSRNIQGACVNRAPETLALAELSAC